MPRYTKQTAHQPISRLEEFKTNGALSARGHHGPGDELMFGRMGEAGRSAIKALPDVNYAVYSYATPIGVHSESQGWVIPEQKYGVTTSVHQGQLNLGASKSGRPVKNV